ncbi:peroxisomal biogenesis factor 19-like [Tropilaelaps mercedesae]|uniref:Peroxin-19 n=1 Tax=Tropilaelaps mercedesae TaxID=418985 RepID=A0A1V9XTU5_9ACAR|nr:peroxisomal biogenesis factor 19-like [Tropilaelaps mercedesae]
MAEKQSQPNVDKDLDQLLDSALDDFDSSKNIVELANEPTPAVAGKDTTFGAANKGASAPPDESGPWTAEFAQMEAMRKLLTDQNLLPGDQLKEQYAFNDTEFLTTLQKTLETIASSADQLKFSEGAAPGGSGLDEISRLFGAMSLEETKASGNALRGFIDMGQKMLQKLLSKDLLYPALKDLTERYPKWLADNRESVSSADIARYEKQLAVIMKTCKAFDEEQESDSDDLKKERFDRIFKLMQEMQEYGDPPAELVHVRESIPECLTDQLLNAPSECNQQ